MNSQTYLKWVTVHSVPSNTLRDAKNMNLLVQSTRSQTVDKALLLQGFAIVGTAFLI